MNPPAPTVPSRPKTSLGVIGLGLLGSALAQRALGLGLTVLGHDLDPDRCADLEKLGGQTPGSNSRVAVACSRLVLALPDDQVTRRVLDELAPRLQPGTVILDATTGDPDAATTFARELAARGVTYLDTPVSGSSAQVRAGTALILAGGPSEAFAELQDLLPHLAGRVRHTGPVGSGARMKLVSNLVLGLNRAALAEGLVFAQALGLDAELTLDLLRDSLAYSRIMDTKGEKMIRGDFTPQARLSQHLKDVRLMLTAAERAGRILPLSQTHRALLERAEELGFGDLDNSAILKAVESLP